MTQVVEPEFPKAVEQAFKAADILIQNGGFGVIALDLGNVDEKMIRKIPLTTWFRFARVMEALPTALVVMLTHSAAQSCAALTLNMDASAQWLGSEEVSHTRLISSVQFDLEIGRTRSKKPAQSATTSFTATPRTWATMIWIVVLLVVFVTMQELSRVLGKGRLKYMFLGHMRTPTAEERPRDAARSNPVPGRTAVSTPVETNSQCRWI